MVKLNFPRFDGANPQGWLFRVERYLAYQNIPPVQCVPLASFHLEGLALQWYQWFTKFNGPASWIELTKALLKRFGPTEYDDPAEALSKLKQTTTVAVYQETFERLFQQVDGLPQSFLISSFVAGLKDDI